MICQKEVCAGRDYNKNFALIKWGPDIFWGYSIHLMEFTRTSFPVFRLYERLCLMYTF